MQAEFTGPWYAAYESGCTGLHLCRELRALGIDCDVIAVSSIARSDSDKKRKNDKRDASRLLTELLSLEPSFSIVWMPDPETEAMRDLVRTRLDAMAAAKASKNQVSGILLRHGIVWNRKTQKGNLKATWTREYVSWVKAIDLGDEPAQAALEFCIQTVEENLERVRILDKKLVALSELPRWKPYVDALTLLKGIDWFSALLLTAEIGDFHRFRSGRDISNWIGTVPKEGSSADNINKGPITKAGNSHCRTILVEGMAGASMRKRGHEEAPVRAGRFARRSGGLLQSNEEAEREVLVPDERAAHEDEQGEGRRRQRDDSLGVDHRVPGPGRAESGRLLTPGATHRLFPKGPSSRMEEPAFDACAPDWEVAPLQRYARRKSKRLFIHSAESLYRTTGVRAAGKTVSADLRVPIGVWITDIC